MKPTDEEVKKAIQTILEDKKSFMTSLTYAVSYCREAMHMHGEELRVQVLYILNNIQKWRHPDAKEVRRLLKAFGGVK